MKLSEGIWPEVVRLLTAPGNHYLDRGERIAREEQKIEF
jgi:hypothetical protein